MERQNVDSSRDARGIAALAEGPQAGTIGELVHYIRNNKKWWLTPIIVMMLLVGLLVIAGGSGAAPFIYTLF